MIHRIGTDFSSTLTVCPPCHNIAANGYSSSSRYFVFLVSFLLLHSPLGTQAHGSVRGEVLCRAAESRAAVFQVDSTIIETTGTGTVSSWGAMQEQTDMRPHSSEELCSWHRVQGTLGCFPVFEPLPLVPNRKENTGHCCSPMALSGPPTPKVHTYQLGYPLSFWFHHYVCT